MHTSLVKFNNCLLGHCIFVFKNLFLVTSAKEGMFLAACICPFVKELEKLWTDFEISRKCRQCHKDTWFNFSGD